MRHVWKNLTEWIRSFLKRGLVVTNRYSVSFEEIAMFHPRPVHGLFSRASLP